MPNRRPAKVNHKRRMTPAAKERQKREARADHDLGPRYDIPGTGLRVRMENHQVRAVKLPPEGDPYG